MITISSYLHRDLLNDIIRRWMYDDPRPSDAESITQLVHFNNQYVSRYLQTFGDRLFIALHGEGLQKKQARLKGDLKDVIVRNPPHLNARVEELIRGYRVHPGWFFRETPCQATLFFAERHGLPSYVGSLRIKRIRRLAEKGARRLIDGMNDAIKRNADQLADERAKRIGIPRERLITAPEDMISEFLRAEGRLLEDLRLRLPLADVREKPIDDVAGIKVILEDGEQQRLMSVLAGMPDTEVMEVEHHKGRYNDTNLIVRYRPPKEDLLQSPPDHHLLALMKARGYTADETCRDFADFLRSGEEDVHLEIIASSYEEMLESEIGRSMHEDRIIEQRMKPQYRGHLAKNVECLMRFLFLFPFSPRCHLEMLPIKIWNRYLPEYFDAVVAELFQIAGYGIPE